MAEFKLHENTMKMCKYPHPPKHEKNAVLPRSHFHHNNGASDGLHTYCKDCVKVYDGQRKKGLNAHGGPIVRRPHIKRRPAPPPLTPEYEATRKRIEERMQSHAVAWTPDQIANLMGYSVDEIIKAIATGDLEVLDIDRDRKPVVVRAAQLTAWLDKHGIGS